VSCIAINPSSKDLRFQILEAIGLFLELLHESFVPVQVGTIRSEGCILHEVIELLAGVLDEFLNVAVDSCGLVQPMLKVVLDIINHVVIEVAPLLLCPLVE
jgi:ABC-type enterochelin transport system permease subunit